jgi:hypothetical protein
MLPLLSSLTLLSPRWHFFFFVNVNKSSNMAGVIPGLNIGEVMLEVKVNEQVHLGNVLGKFMGGRRIASNEPLIKSFGSRILALYPGMGDFMSRELFGSAGQETSIQWTLDEIKRLTQNSSHGYGADAQDSILNGINGGKWPIAETYDYILSLDETVGNILNEIARVKSLGSLARLQRTNMSKRILRADFRPEWYHNTPLGQLDNNSLVVTTGQALGDPNVYRNNQIVQKNNLELAEDNALLLSYSHMNAVVSLCQGLFKVIFTVTDAFDGNGSFSRSMVPSGSWVNAVGAVYSDLSDDQAEEIATGEGNRSTMVLYPQDTDLRKYANNRYNRENRDILRPSNVRGSFEMQQGGAMPTWFVHQLGGGQSSAKVHRVHDSTVDTVCGTVTGKHAMQYVPHFKQTMKSLNIDRALNNLHADLLVIYEDQLFASGKNTSNPGDHWAIGMRNGCTPGTVKVFRDKRGQMVSQFISTKQGNIRNPNIHGPGQCSSIVRDQNYPNLAPGLKASASAALHNAQMWKDGLPGMGFHANAAMNQSQMWHDGLPGMHFQANAKSKKKKSKKKKSKKKKSKKKKSKKKKSKKKKSKKKKSKTMKSKNYTATSKRKDGNVVYKCPSGLFVRKKTMNGFRRKYL